MDNENGFDLLIYIVFDMTTQLRGLVPKAKYIVISFSLGEEETIKKLHLSDLQIISENFMFKIKQDKSTTSQSNTSWKFQN